MSETRDGVIAAYPRATYGCAKVCGCAIVGTGSIDEPWRIDYCPMHAAAQEVGVYLKRMIAWHEWRDRGEIPAGAILSLGEEISKARALLVKAEGARNV